MVHMPRLNRECMPTDYRPQTGWVHNLFERSLTSIIVLYTKPVT